MGFEVTDINALANNIIETCELRFGSKWRPSCGDFALSWLEAARIACQDEDLACLLNLMLCLGDAPDPAGNRYIIKWAEKVAGRKVQYAKEGA